MLDCGRSRSQGLMNLSSIICPNGPHLNLRFITLTALRQPLFRRRFPFHPPPVTTLLPSSSSLLPPPPFQSHPLKENRFKTGIMFLPIHFPNRVLTHLCPPCRRSAVQVKNSRLESHSTPLHRTRE